MLRGFRWQLLALLIAAGLFTVTLVNRLNSPVLPQPTASSEPTATNPATQLPTVTPNAGVLIQPENQTSEVKTFREGLIGTVQRLNPLLVELNPVEQDITSLIFEGLTRNNAYGEPEPSLAKEWVISPNRLEYVVTLRDDILWQDGIPFTATDVAFTMALLRAPGFPGSEAVGDFWRTVETEQLGSHLVRFRLTQPLGSFLDKLRVGMLPEHALRGVPADQLATHSFNLSPIGTGPYQLEALRTADNNTITQIDLRVAPVFRQRPAGETGYAIDRLSFHFYPRFDDALAALTSNAIDGLASRNRHERAALLTTSPIDFNTATTLEPTLGVLIFNWQRDETRYFREQRVRLALETGIDRTSVIERWLFNSAVRADSPLWPGSWAYEANLEWPPSDLTVARFLLETANLSLPDNREADSETPSEDVADEAAARAEPTAVPYLASFSILTPEDPTLENMLQEVAVQWSQLNLNVIIEAVPAAIYHQRLTSGAFDMALVELSLGDSADPDVYDFWHQGQYPDGLNYGGASDSRISEMLEKARRDPSGINRSLHYAAFQQTFVERAIAIPLYYPLFTYVTSASVSGVQLGFIGRPADRFRTLQHWQLGD